MLCCHVAVFRKMVNHRVRHACRNRLNVGRCHSVLTWFVIIFFSKWACLYLRLRRWSQAQAKNGPSLCCAADALRYFNGATRNALLGKTAAAGSAPCRLGKNRPNIALNYLNSIIFQMSSTFNKFMYFQRSNLISLCKRLVWFVKFKMNIEKNMWLGGAWWAQPKLWYLYAGFGVCRMKSSSLNICILSEIIEKLFNKIPSMCSQLWPARLPNEEKS